MMFSKKLIVDVFWNRSNPVVIKPNEVKWVITMKVTETKCKLLKYLKYEY